MEQQQQETHAKWGSGYEKKDMFHNCEPKLRVLFCFCFYFKFVFSLLLLWMVHLDLQNKNEHCPSGHIIFVLYYDWSLPFGKETALFCNFPHSPSPDSDKRKVSSKGRPDSPLPAKCLCFSYLNLTWLSTTNWVCQAIVLWRVTLLY